MKPARVHSWNVSPNEASAIQLNLREKVAVSSYTDYPRLIAGTAVTLDPSNETIHAGLVVLQYPGMGLVEQYAVSEGVKFPYISGLLAFREGPPLMRLFLKVEHKPDIIFFHSHGQAHPRRFGLASHVGVLLDTPSIGVSKRILVGEHKSLKQEKGGFAHILYRDDEVGLAIRTKEGVDPLYLSVGHKVDSLSAMQLLLACVSTYRLPEPLRLAQLAVNSHKEGEVVDVCLGGDQTTLF